MPKIEVLREDDSMPTEAKKPSTEGFAVSRLQQRVVFGFLIAFLVLVLSAVGCTGGLILAYCIHHYGDQQHQIEPAPFDQQDERQDEKRESKDLSGCWLVFVIENTAPTAEQIEAMREYDAEAVEALGMKGFFRIDEEQEEAQSLIQYALGRGVGTPAVFLMRDKEPIACEPFRNVDDIKRLIGG
ncbi:hypothetical protein [Roseiconus lacunae]|uniref:hypothetical protein n=1 Tax=Roseiconus lacunae TaxID=2605694 RepID=UPI001E2D4AA8|nr:hypothetical protein [Roseiconus lacunae]MCD0459134.1 hypothetical protein [Roseiconus lacunae]